eukprot:766890-Hanusia_phi.AAC.4
MSVSVEQRLQIAHKSLVEFDLRKSFRRFLSFLRSKGNSCIPCISTSISPGDEYLKRSGHHMREAILRLNRDLRIPAVSPTLQLAAQVAKWKRPGHSCLEAQEPTR